MDIDTLLSESFAIGMAQVKLEAKQLYAYFKSMDTPIVHNFMEIGTKQGGNFYGLCNLCQGLKISVDLIGGPYGGWATNTHPYLGDIVSKRDKYFKDNFKNVHMIHGDSHYVTTRLQVERVLGNEKLGLLYIDGDHSYEGVKADYEFYKDLVHKDGIIVFHDINNTEHHRKTGCEVYKLWQELEGNKIEFNQNLHWSGIGVLNQK